MAALSPHSVSIPAHLLQAFYRRQVLWSLVNHLDYKPSRVKRTAWHRFLDDLSWLCDTQTGGKTTTSIIVEDTDPTLRFWIVSNQRSGIARRRLEFLLQTLHILDDPQSGSARKVEMEILKRTVMDCKRKICNYIKILQNYIRKALVHEQILRGQFTSAGSSSEQIRAFIHGMQRDFLVTEDPWTLCNRAFEYYEAHSSDSIKALSLDGDALQVWSRIRHYIGRLASWKKSIVFVVRMWAKSTILHRKYDVKLVPRPAKPPRFEPKGLADFGQVLQDILPQGNLERLLQNVETHQSTIPTEFCNRLNDTNNQPFVHAEVTMVDHCSRSDVRFLNNDRYVGVSKPSCYCCQFYMSHHPWKFKPRICSSNVWSKWSPPLLSDGQYWFISPNSLQAVLGMQAKLEQDIQRFMMTDLSKRKYGRALDSITDLSSSLPTVHSGS